MERLTSGLLLSLLLMFATHANARGTFVVSPSVGSASINNISGYDNANFLRVDGGYYPLPELGINLFGVGYSNFNSNGGGNSVAIKLSGYGPGVTGRWPVHPNVQPYVRIDYMLWKTEATGLGRTLANDKGGSAGLAVGAQFPIKRLFGLKAEVSGYNNVSGANIRQVSVGAAFEF